MPSEEEKPLFMVQLVENADSDFELSDAGDKVAKVTLRELALAEKVIARVASWLARSLEAIEPRPDMSSVEFGIALSVGGQVPLITKMTAQSNFKISLSWKNQPPAR